MKSRQKASCIECSKETKYATTSLPREITVLGAAFTYIYHSAYCSKGVI